MNAIDRAKVFTEALPYIQRFHGQVIVIKLGGAALRTTDVDSVLQDIVLLHFLGMKPIVVHGGGPEISETQERLGMEPRFVNGLRVTDEQAIDVVKMVLAGKIGPEICATIQRLGGKAVGLSGDVGPVILARPRYGDNGEDLGFVGSVERINRHYINVVLSGGAIPVIQPLGLGRDGKVYNINADDVAAEVAVAERAAKCILCTDVEGVRDTAGKLLSEISRSEVNQMLASGAINGGMIPKVRAALRATDGGSAVHIIDGRLQHALLLELLTDRGVGTMVRNPDRSQELI